MNLLGKVYKKCFYKHFQLILNRCQSSLTITDPLILYQSYITLGKLKPDEAQYRAMREIRALYNRVKDYNPPTDYKHKMEILINLLKEDKEKNLNNSDNSNKIFNFWSNPQKKTNALVKQLSDLDEIFNLDTPKGLLINGEVGSGKSMLMDIFANSLPHISKKRWHYNTFILHLYSRINFYSLQYAKNKYNLNNYNNNNNNNQNEYVMLKIARELIDESTILLLDEFMLPDICAAKILQSVLMHFFKFGGVLVATSNRLPEDLYSTEFNKKQFVEFYSILQNRCLSYDMYSKNDWRVLISNSSDSNLYFLLPNNSQNNDKIWLDNVEKVCGKHSNGKKAFLSVYGRTIIIPWEYNGIAKLDFNDLFKEQLGPPDYIALVNKYHTIILDKVPILSLKMKDHARRLITFIDALYESRVKLMIRAQVPPDNLFFPEAKLNPSLIENDKLQNSLNEDLLEREMYTKVVQDIENPYRPNIASYDETISFNEYSSKPKKEKQKKYENSQFQNKCEPINPSSSLKENNINNHNSKIKKVFQSCGDIYYPSTFTGDDEKFAYKRAVSRLKEMTSSNYWKNDILHQILQVPKPIPNNTELKQLRSSDINYKNKFGQNSPEFSSQHFWSLGAWGPGKRLKDSIAKKWIKGNS